MFGDRKAFPLFPNSTFDHFDGRVSPDGKWIAYMSRESGVIQLYVTSFPNGVGKWQISSETTQPDAVWRADGKELYFVSRGGNMIVASIQESAGSITVGEIRPLFHSLFLISVVSDPRFSPSQESKRTFGSSGLDMRTTEQRHHGPICGTDTRGQRLATDLSGERWTRI